MLAQGKGGIGDEREPALDRRRGQAAGPDLLEIAGGEGTPCGPHGSHRARPGDQHGRVCLACLQRPGRPSDGQQGPVLRPHFEPRSISVELAGEEATVKSEVQWNARHWTFPAAKSQEIRAIYSHTWKVRRSSEGGKAVVVLNHVDHMRYVEGCEPPEAKHKVDPHIGHEV